MQLQDIYFPNDLLILLVGSLRVQVFLHELHFDGGRRYTRVPEN